MDLASETGEVDIDQLIPSPRIERLKLKKTMSIPVDLLINESTNEGTQAIINHFYPGLLGIDNSDPIDEGFCDGATPRSSTRPSWAGSDRSLLFDVLPHPDPNPNPAQMGRKS